MADNSVLAASGLLIVNQSFLGQNLGQVLLVREMEVSLSYVLCSIHMKALGCYTGYKVVFLYTLTFS
jgi:hypothetical protein